jgi:hypothetical protein
VLWPCQNLHQAQLPLQHPHQTTRQMVDQQVRRACSGPGLWPGPRRQARWAGRGLRGQRRAAGASRVAGCEAPLRPEGPARTMRGVPARWLCCDIFPAISAPRASLTAWPCSCGAAPGPLRRGSAAAGAGAAVRGSRRARRAAARKGASEAAAPQRRDPGNPGRLPLVPSRSAHSPVASAHSCTSVLAVRHGAPEVRP